MNNAEILRLAKLKGYSYETARELTTFNAPRRQFRIIEKRWREYIE